MNLRLCIPLLAVALFSSGCGIMIKAQRKERAAPGKVLVNFHRQTRFVGSAQKFGMWDRNVYIGSLGSGSMIQYECDPGSHLFVFVMMGGSKSALQVTLVQDRVYDLALPITVQLGNPPAFIFDLVPLSQLSVRTQKLLLTMPLFPTKPLPGKAEAHAIAHAISIGRMLKKFDSGQWGRLVMRSNDHRVDSP